MKRLLPLAAALLFTAAHADEGQWQPYQMAQLQAELKRIGIKVPVSDLSDLSKHPMSAIVSLGGCSASFVSPNGLIVTNHHCAYGSIQRNSTAANNYLAKGFLAKSLAEELPGGPNQRVYVTESVRDVTAEVLNGIAPELGGAERTRLIERNSKALIAACESSPDYRCTLPSFHRGLEFYLIRQMMVRDVRLVYAPSEAIGNYGGDIDNFEFPRHTGDFAFYRAYVGKDGRPADPSPDNVPYASKDFLTVSAAGLKRGDGILLAGYPGVTSRYRLPAEIRYARENDYPKRVADYRRDLDAIAAATAGDTEAEVRYAATVKSINNRMKKLQGLLDGFARKDIPAIKDAQLAEFLAWTAGQKDAARYRALMGELNALIARDQNLAEREFAMGLLTSNELLGTASSAYRFARERGKPDMERELGFQDRDASFIKARFERLQQSYVGRVDRARWLSALQSYQRLPESQRDAASESLVLRGGDPGRQLDAVYAGSTLADTAERLALLQRSAAELEASGDALVKLAVALYPAQQRLREERRALDGDLDRVIPQYMQAVIAWKKSQGKPVYPDANGTLRITYGTVDGYPAADGLYKGPFTTVQGIVAKHTGRDPFDAPAALREAVAQRRFGPYVDPVLGTVPVNFLSSADTTGGNSGSAVMNARGELVGLNFDSTYESITKDWYFDPEITRAIHVDIRYMLWVMSELDGADNLLREMRIVYPQNTR
ncbi:peptidase S46 [Arenimonas maotaiensis]|uniref:Dipeptidyl-peptidase n=1 Tax=Arenimonas maotaiensis TaxID=1446479 RepID=A0A917CT15_9GAMM|nr:S46 family peptidase [Arenimonas maotaiensis]GGF98664.1 peptidase S46 [Arenimonas maotaiensis]